MRGEGRRPAVRSRAGAGEEWCAAEATALSLREGRKWGRARRRHGGVLGAYGRGKGEQPWRQGRRQCGRAAGAG